MGESRSRRRRTAGSLTFVVLATCLATGLFVPTVAQASCAGPSLAVGPTGSTPDPYPTEPQAVVAAPPGGGLAVTGTFFLDGCDDVQSCSAGCGGCQSVNPAYPMKGLTLVLVRGPQQYEFGAIDAQGDSGDVRWDVTIPGEVPPGPAQLEVQWAYGAGISEDGVVASVPVTIT